MTLALRPNEDITINSFFASLRNNEYIRRWHQIYLTLWWDVDFDAHPILRHMRLYSPPTDNNALNIQMRPEVYTDYFAQALSGERLSRLIDSNDGFNGRVYHQTKAYLLPVLPEMYYFPKRHGWDGNKKFEVLATQYDTAEIYQDDRFHRAKNIVHDLLQNKFMIELLRGSEGVSKPWLAYIWNEPHYHNADNEPGTISFYLRQKILRINSNKTSEAFHYDATHCKGMECWVGRALSRFMTIESAGVAGSRGTRSIKKRT